MSKNVWNKSVTLSVCLFRGMICEKGTYCTCTKHSHKQKHACTHRENQTHTVTHTVPVHSHTHTHNIHTCKNSHTHKEITPTQLQKHMCFIAEAISRDKFLTKQLLRRLGIPVPTGRLAADALK